jgi:glycerol uptake facilitator-like aquaporin
MTKYLAEFIGTFSLALAVLLAVATANSPIAIPILAGLVVATFVYTVGPVSGCHLNPSVTLAQLSIKKISIKDAAIYIVVQFLGALLAMGLVKFMQIGGTVGSAAGGFRLPVFIAEIFGAFFLNFGIASVVYGKAKEQVSGLVIGGSLILGVIVASMVGSSGIINPAVALALNSLTLVYAFAPIIGAVLGAQIYKLVAAEK